MLRPRILPTPTPTCLDLVLERHGTVLHQLLQCDRVLGDVQREQLLHVLRMVEVKDLLLPVVLYVDVVDQQLGDFVQELARLRRIGRLHHRDDVFNVYKKGEVLEKEEKYVYISL